MDKSTFEKSMTKLRELRAILSRISSLRNGSGGDVFFKSLAQSFGAQTFIPQITDPEKEIEKYVESKPAEVKRTH